MARALVVGAGPVGLAAAVLLAERGLDVTVLDRDVEGPPASAEEAWSAWDRHGVAQFRQAHILLAGGHQTLCEHLPGFPAALVDDGGCRYNAFVQRPAHLAGWAVAADDDRFDTVTARRPVLEHAFTRVAEETPGVEVRRGVAVRALVTGPSALPGTPHVTGVVSATGEVLHADVVLDVTGRGSTLPDRLGEIGATVPDPETSSAGFAYYTRFFRSRDGAMPEPLAPLLSPLGSISLLTLPADHATWSVTVYASTADRLVRAVRDPATFDRLLAACPLHAHWIDAEPLGGVDVMASVLGKRRTFEIEGRPIATGLVAIGDAWAYTNPSLGRGITLGLRHAVRTAQVVADHLDDPAASAAEWLDATERELRTWYDATLLVDRSRIAEMELARLGRELPFDAADRRQVLLRALGVAVGRDPEVFRAALEIQMCLALPGEVLSRPGMVERIHEVAGGDAPGPLPGPDRAGLEELLGVVAGARRS